jgi:signal-transduction protein with cAMP-binding, CBS, and nucleotidyltransferase domain
MLDDDIPAEAILQTITEINNEVHRGVVEDAVAALEADGWGAAPLPYSFVVMGSSGRAENFLEPDQDNALVIADGEADARQSSETYFIALAERICHGLAEAGFSYCKGNMMATSPVWRKSEAEWRLQIRSWIRQKNPVQLMNCDTLLDFAHCAGERAMADKLRCDLLESVRREPGFLRALYSIEEEHGVALDWLGRLSRHKDDFGTIAEVNVKLGGTLPLIEGARLLAVGAGVTATSTVERLRKIGDRGVLDEETVAGLIDAFRVITAQLLRHQLAAAEKSTGSAIRISHASMSRSQKAALRSALRRIARFRAGLVSQLDRGAAARELAG